MNNLYFVLKKKLTLKKIALLVELLSLKILIHPNAPLFCSLNNLASIIGFCFAYYANVLSGGYLCPQTHDCSLSRLGTTARWAFPVTKLILYFLLRSKEKAF
jgi:hypothetical protein